MGATNFRNTVKGQTAEQAFADAVREARHYYGHGGYTGSIAEKRGFTVLNVPEAVPVQEWCRSIEWGEPIPGHEAAYERARRIWDDKYGPALCYAVEPGETYVFMGMASQ